MNETRPQLIVYAGLTILAVAALLVVYVQSTNRPDTADTTMSVSQPEVKAPVPVPTWTPTAVTVTTVSPTSTPASVQVANTPVPAPDANAYTVRSNANVRGGPGTNYQIVDGRQAGDSVQPIGRTEDAQWLELVGEHWIYAPLVDGDASRLPITRDFPAPPPQPTVAPPTPAPVADTTPASVGDATNSPPYLALYQPGSGTRKVERISNYENLDNATVSGFDPDDEDTEFRFEITGGDDANLLYLYRVHGSKSIILTFHEVPDYDDPHDHNRDNLYEIQLTVTSGTGERELSNAVDFIYEVRDRKEVAFAPLLKEDKTTATTSTITVYWSLDPYGQGLTIKGYRLRYREEVWGLDESDYDAFSTGPDVGARATSATIKGLKSSTVYRIEIQALADGSNSNFEDASLKFLTEGQTGPDQSSWSAEDRNRLFDLIQDGNQHLIREMLRVRDFPSFLHNTSSGRLTAVHFAARQDKDALFGILDRYERDTELRCDIGGDAKTRNITALHYAIIVGNYNSVVVLRDQGANLNAQAAEGHTPLHFAVLHDRPSILEFLMFEPRIDPNIKDNTQWTALAHAVELDNAQLVESMLEIGDRLGSIDISIQNDAGLTPLQQARALGGRDRIIALLEQYGE